MAGNSLVSRIGDSFEYSESMIRELIRCKNDILYFAEHYIFVIHPSKGKIHLELRDYQMDILRDFVEKKSLVLLSSRQSGKCFSNQTKIKVNLKNNLENTAKIMTAKELFEIL